MSDPETTTTLEVPPAEAPQESALFSPEDLKEFDADDTEAGRNICKMLSLFFFYTLIVMSISTYVTIKWVL